MDEDTEIAAYAQQEQDERRHREDALIQKTRKATASFRVECDEFHADFTRSLRSTIKRELHENE